MCKPRRLRQTEKHNPQEFQTGGHAVRKLSRFFLAVVLAALAALGGALPAFAGFGSSPGGPFGR